MCIFLDSACGFINPTRTSLRTLLHLPCILVDNCYSATLTFVAPWQATHSYEEMSFQSIYHHSYTFMAEIMDSFCF